MYYKILWMRDAAASADIYNMQLLRHSTVHFLIIILFFLFSKKENIVIKTIFSEIKTISIYINKIDLDWWCWRTFNTDKMIYIVSFFIIFIVYFKQGMGGKKKEIFLTYMNIKSIVERHTHSQCNMWYRWTCSIHVII